MSQLARALFISRKDVESYYAKPPLITWGLLFPAVLILALYVKNPATYAETAPGIVAMTLLFGSTSMAAIVVTFEKRSGTLERLLVAPVATRTIILGKAASAAAYGLCTSVVLTAGIRAAIGMRFDSLAAYAAGLVLGAAAFALLGLVVAVSVREVFEAMTLLNFFRFPLLFVSGVFVGVEKLPVWASPAAYVSPLTYVAELLRFGASGESAFGGPWIPAAGAALFVIVGWCAAGYAFKRRATF
jgi:ABC-2 type transport system permease protein